MTGVGKPRNEFCTRTGASITRVSENTLFMKATPDESDFCITRISTFAVVTCMCQ